MFRIVGAEARALELLVLVQTAVGARMVVTAQRLVRVGAAHQRLAVQRARRDAQVVLAVRLGRLALQRAQLAVGARRVPLDSLEQHNTQCYNYECVQAWILNQVKIPPFVTTFGDYFTRNVKLIRDVRSSNSFGLETCLFSKWQCLFALYKC